jgi:hypothetical protein
MQALIRNHLLSAMEGFTPDYNEMRSLLLKKDDYTSVFDIYETFIAEGQNQFADTYISMWNANDISDPYVKLQLQKFQVVHAILYTYYYAGNRLVALPNADRVVLETIADGCFGKATLKARSVLTDLFVADFETKPVCNPYLPVVFASGTQIRASAGVKYAVQPNPASEYLEVFCFDRLCQNATLTVYDINGLSVGIAASKHDKGSGKLLGRTSFVDDEEYTYVNGRTRIYDTGQALHFVVSSYRYAYQLAYNYIDDTMTLIDTVSQSGNSSVDLLDFELFPDSVVYYGRFNDRLGWVTKYPDQSTKLVHWKPKHNNYHFYKFMHRDNVNRIFFGHENISPYKVNIIVAEVDPEGNFIWERKNQFDDAYEVMKVLPLNNDEVLILLSNHALDEKLGVMGVFRQVVKFDLKSKTFGNPKSYEKPLPPISYADLIKSTRDTGTYFVCTGSYVLTIIQDGRILQSKRQIVIK